MPPVDHHISGKVYWRSLDELANNDHFRQWADQEFPGYDPQKLLAMSRRRFLQLMGASLAMAGVTLTGCRRWPEQQLAPFAKRPEGRVPGEPEHFASVMPLHGLAWPVMVTAFDGRPIKVDANPHHPFASNSAADVLAQASVLGLYDPERNRDYWQRQPNRDNAKRTLGNLLQFARGRLGGLAERGGAGLVVLSEPTSSPSLLAIKRRFMQRFPDARWLTYDPTDDVAARTAARQCFGRDVLPVYDLAKAEVILSLDADPLGQGPSKLRNAAGWAEGRRNADHGHMSRMWVAESTYTITGASADERLPIPAGRIAPILRHVLAGDPLPAHPNAAAQAAWLRRALEALKAHQGRGLVVAGPTQPAEVHALCCALNTAYGNAGQTVRYLPDPTDASGLEGITELASLLEEEGGVDTLLVLGGNPAFDAPADLALASRLPNAGAVIHLTSDFNETSALADWVAPQAHYLESWGDARAADGTLSVQQPLIQPLYKNALSAVELLAQLLDERPFQSYEIVRNAWRPVLGDQGFEAAWRRTVHDGFLAGSAASPLAPGASMPSVGRAAAALPNAPRPDGFELTFTFEAKMGDGRWANNPWLQEQPHPLTKVTWDNAALMNPADTEVMGAQVGRMVRLTLPDGGEAELPVYPLPGQPRGAITVALGYGRWASGNVGTRVGFNTYAYRRADAMYLVPGVRAEASGKRYKLVSTQDHHAIDEVAFEARGRRIGKLVREATLDEYQKNPRFAEADHHGLDVTSQPFDPPVDFDAQPNAWAMAVDLNTCIGCGACEVACMAENNIPVVGKDEVEVGREMNWIRVDRYFKGGRDDENPQVVHQPLMCVHCENAPCEQVCPVAATVHDTEGLNTMVYNRCIGTRYCSNNCPYNVRRFNYFDYHAKDPRGAARPWLGMPDQQQVQMINPIKQMVFNPEVTVRMRGVMEKCTFCVQRIQAAKIHARLEHAKGQRPEDRVVDGDLTTACAAACPTQAIVFGNLNDPASRVAQLHAHARSYKILTELNTRPRLAYLGRVRNPAPAVEKADDNTHDHG